MTTDYSYLYNQIFLVFIHPKITCQLAMTNDWELLIEGSKWAQIFRKHEKKNLVRWKFAAGHRASSNFHNKKNAADGVKLPHPIRNRVKLLQLKKIPFVFYFRRASLNTCYEWGNGGKKAPYQFFPCNFY